jgi:hypothetical protein
MITPVGMFGVFPVGAPKGPKSNSRNLIIAKSPGHLKSPQDEGVTP